jgi:hypothetical protein
MINKLKTKFWMWVLFKFPVTRRGNCANRHTRTGKLGQFTVTITFRDTAQPDGYSHTDLYRMLTAIRRAEKDSGLRIPEPGQFTIESGPIDLT